MYITRNFQQNSTEQMVSLIKAYPFATMISESESGIDVNHIPVLLKQVNGKHIIEGHFAKMNPVVRSIAQGSEVLVIFQGPNYYISPNYYPTKKDSGKAVPTWNYAAVHVRGALAYSNDKAVLLEHISNLTDEHESGQSVPWSVSDAPEDYIDKMLSAITVFQIEVESMVGKWKVSQNQPDINKQGIVAALSESQDCAAKRMAEMVASPSL